MNKKLERLLKPSTAVLFPLMFLFGVVALALEQYILAAVELGVTSAVFIGYLMFRRYRRKKVDDFISKLTQIPGASQNTEHPFPMLAIRLADGGIVHVNDAFAAMSGFRDMLSERSIYDYIPDFDTDWLTSGKTEWPNDVTMEKRRFRVYGTMANTEELQNLHLGILYFVDMTELYQVHDEYIRSRPVVSIVLVDNYDEMTRDMSEGDISGLDAQLNNTIMNWAQEYHGLLRRLEKNRFLLIFEKRDLRSATDGKFSVLENIHDIIAPNGLSASLSIGLGVDGATYVECYQFAALSLEMALSRGGDQAVVKDRLNFSFYGGRTKETDQRSKVRSRVTANTMMELFSQSSQVFVMGHKNADLDSVGAAMGIVCLCRKAGKPVRVILDVENNSCPRFVEEIAAAPEYRNLFVTGEEALVMFDGKSTLVVVDTNRPDQVEYRPILEAANRICVVDHHLRAADYIKSVTVNFHEPHASSTAELVTELLEYAVESRDVLPLEAKALMAGIYLDTKQFNVRTGERTFEAAAYLRQLGVDTVEIKHLFQHDFQNTLAKHKIVEAARMYNHGIAIAALKGSTTRALAAQAADEILNIIGVAASFVLFSDGNSVFISARSVGDANVQLILESLGGGGNAATAGAQIPGKTVSEVLPDLQAAIDQYYSE